MSDAAAVDTVELLRTTLAPSAFFPAGQEARGGAWRFLGAVVVDLTSHLAVAAAPAPVDPAVAAAQACALVLRVADAFCFPPESRPRALLLYLSPQAAWDAVAASVTRAVAALVRDKAPGLELLLSSPRGIVLTNASVDGRRVRRVAFRRGDADAASCDVDHAEPVGLGLASDASRLAALCTTLLWEQRPDAAAPQPFDVHVDLSATPVPAAVSVVVALVAGGERAERERAERSVWNARHCRVTVAIGPQLVVDVNELAPALARAGGSARTLALFWAMWQTMRASSRLGLASRWAAAAEPEAEGGAERAARTLWTALTALPPSALNASELRCETTGRREMYFDPPVELLAHAIAAACTGDSGQPPPDDAAQHYALVASGGGPCYAVFEQLALRTWWQLNEIMIGWRCLDCDWASAHGHDGAIARIYAHGTRSLALGPRQRQLTVQGDALKRSVDAILAPPASASAASISAGMGTSPTVDEAVEPAQKRARVDPRA